MRRRAEVQQHEQAAARRLADVRQQVSRGLERAVGTDRECGLGAAQRDQAAVERKHRGGIVPLDEHVRGRVVGGQREPGGAGREAGVGGVVPLHRRAHRIAAEPQPGDVLLPRILHPVRRDLDIAHPELVAVVHRGGAAEREEQHRRHAGLGGAHAAGDAGTVMVTQDPVRPAMWRKQRLVTLDRRGDGASLPGQLEQLEVEGEMAPRALLAVVGDQPLDGQV